MGKAGSSRVGAQECSVFVVPDITLLQCYICLTVLRVSHRCSSYQQLVPAK
jgi:hypothetical protein